MGFQIHDHGLELAVAVDFITFFFGDRLIFRSINTESRTGRFYFKFDLLELAEAEGIPNL